MEHPHTLLSRDAREPWAGVDPLLSTPSVFDCRHQVTLTAAQRSAAITALMTFQGVRGGAITSSVATRLRPLLPPAIWRDLDTALQMLELTMSDSGWSAQHPSAFRPFEDDPDDAALLDALSTRPGYGPYMELYAEYFAKTLQGATPEEDAVTLLLDDLHLHLLQRACAFDALLCAGHIASIATVFQEVLEGQETWWALWHSLSEWTNRISEIAPPLTAQHPAAMAHTIAEALTRYIDDLRTTGERREFAAAQLRRQVDHVPHVPTPLARTLGLATPTILLQGPPA